MKARSAFEKLITRFPNSKFSFLAEKKLRECKERQAEHEFYVGEFYYRTKRYPSDLERFQTIASEYPEFKPGEVKGYVAKCQNKIANPTKKSGNFITNLFDARW